MPPNICFLPFVTFLGTVPDSDGPSSSQNAVSQPRNVPRSVSVVAKSGSSLAAKSDPNQSPIRRSYSLNLLREKYSDGEIADGENRRKYCKISCQTIFTVLSNGKIKIFHHVTL